MQSITRREDFIGELPSPLGARGFILSGGKLHLFFWRRLDSDVGEKGDSPLFLFQTHQMDKWCCI